MGKSVHLSKIPPANFLSWFPFLFYTTQFIGEVYLRYNAPTEAREHPDTLGQIGRIGSLSLVAFSVITFAGSVMIPWLVESPEQESPEFTPRPPARIARFLLEADKYKPTLLTAWTCAHLIFAGSMAMAPFVTSLRWCLPRYSQSVHYSSAVHRHIHIVDRIFNSGTGQKSGVGEACTPKRASFNSRPECDRRLFVHWGSCGTCRKL